MIWTRTEPRPGYFVVESKGEPSNDDIYQLTLNNEKVNEIKLSALRLNSVALTALSFFGVQLQKVKIEWLNSMDCYDNHWIAYLFSRCPNLRDLTLFSVNFTSDFLNLLAQHGKSLRELSLFHYETKETMNSTMTDGSFVNMLDSLKDLTKLHLQNINDLTPDGLLAVAKHEKLTSLGFFRVANVDDRVIYKILKECSGLKFLFLYKLDISDQTIGTIGVSTLQGLFLKDCKRVSEVALLSIHPTLEQLIAPGDDRFFEKFNAPKLKYVRIEGSVSPNVLQTFRETHPDVTVKVTDITASNTVSQGFFSSLKFW